MQVREIIFRAAENEMKKLQDQCALLNDFCPVQLRSEIAMDIGIDEKIIERIEKGEYDPPLSLMLKILIAQGRTMEVRPFQSIDLVTAKRVGKLLIDYREKTGLTREDLGKKFEIQVKEIESWEMWADEKNAGQLYLVSTPFTPLPHEFREKLLKKFTSAEIDLASKVVLEALELLGIISVTPLLPSPKVAEEVIQFFNQQGSD